MINQKLIKSIQSGITLDSFEPFLEIANELNCEESLVLEKIQELKSAKAIKRFGPVLFNRRVGINQNAMTTLKINPSELDNIGMKISSFEFVTLCYERDPLPNVWDYNLYFMIHGKCRETVEHQINEVLTSLGEEVLDFKILFSSKCFKQKGASY